MTSLITLQLIHKIAQIYKSYCYSCKSHKNRVIGIIDFGRSVNNNPKVIHYNN